MTLWSVTHGAGMTSLIAKVDHITNKREGIEYVDSILVSWQEINTQSQVDFISDVNIAYTMQINLDTTNASIIRTVNVID